MDLHYLMYTSSATGPMSEVRSIIADAYHINPENGITGFLYHEDGAFTQYIEGPRIAVEALFDKIKLDPRHTDIRVIEGGPLEHRNFENWSMELFEKEEETGVPQIITDTLAPRGGEEQIGIVKVAAAIRSARP